MSLPRVECGVVWFERHVGFWGQTGGGCGIYREWHVVCDGDLKEVVFREEERKDAIDVAKNMFANATGDRHQPLSLMILNRASAHMDSVQMTFIDLEKSNMWRREEEEEQGLDIYTGPTTPSGYLAHYELVAQSQCRTWIWSGNTGIWLSWSRCLESREAGSSLVKLFIFRNTRNQTSALTLML
jgi:hypothetical protein